MKSILHHDKNFRRFESKFERRAAKETQIDLRRKREDAKALNTNVSEDYSDIKDIWELDDIS